MEFRELLRKTGQSFCEELEKNILTQKDIDKTQFKRSKGTVKNGKVVSDGGTHDRLIITGQLKRNAFKFTPSDMQLELFVSTNKIPDSNTSYSDVIYRNNKETSKWNNMPKIFPQNEKDFVKVETMKSFESELEKQALVALENLQHSFTITIKVG